MTPDRCFSCVCLEIFCQCARLPVMTGTNIVCRYAAIIFSTSVSLFVVSSKPGVSMRMMRFPSKTNGFDICTSLVQLSSPMPTLNCEPDAALMNYLLYLSELRLEHRN